MCKYQLHRTQKYVRSSFIIFLCLSGMFWCESSLYHSDIFVDTLSLKQLTWYVRETNMWMLRGMGPNLWIGTVFCFRSPYRLWFKLDNWQYIFVILSKYQDTRSQMYISVLWLRKHVIFKDLPMFSVLSDLVNYTPCICTRKFSGSHRCPAGRRWQGYCENVPEDDPRKIKCCRIPDKYPLYLPW